MAQQSKARLNDHQEMSQCNGEATMTQTICQQQQQPTEAQKEKSMCYW